MSAGVQYIIAPVLTAEKLKFLNPNLWSILFLGL